MTSYNLWILSSADGQSKKQLCRCFYACNQMTQENGESKTVHFFSTSLRDKTMCQVFFSGSGMTSHMF